MQRSIKQKQSDKFENIKLYTQHGKEVRFYEDLVKDKVVMVNLMFTTCPKICPANSVRLAKIADYLHPWMGKDIHLLSLSIDPEVDTPERLNEYWQVFGSKSGWVFLTGDYDEIDRLRRALGVYDLDPVIDADKLQHSGVLTFGNDRTNRWAALPILMDTKQLTNTVLHTTWDDQWTRISRKEYAQIRSKLYTGTGFVRKINLEDKIIKIEHDDIEGLMPAMTMNFQAVDQVMLQQLTVGQQINFVVEEKNGSYIINKIQ